MDQQQLELVRMLVLRKQTGQRQQLEPLRGPGPSNTYQAIQGGTWQKGQQRVLVQMQMQRQRNPFDPRRFVPSPSSCCLQRNLEASRGRLLER